MSRLYYFSPEKKEVGYASYFSDFLSDKKDLAHLNELTDFDKLFFVEDVCNILIFKSKKALLKCLKEKLENAKITAEELKRFKKEIKDFKRQ